MTHAKRKTRRRVQRGLTLFEMILAAALLSFVIAGTSIVFNVAQKQQRLSQGYSQDQTDERAALRDMTRAIRHGWGVVNRTSAATLPAYTNFGKPITSDATHLYIAVPNPGSGGAAATEMEYYLSGGILYKLYAGAGQTATAVMTGVQTATFNYTKPSTTNPALLTAVDAAPSTATDVKVTLTVSRTLANGQGGLPPKSTAFVTMRNVITAY